MFKRGLRDISMCYQWPNDDTDLPTGLIVIRFGIEKTGHAVAGEIKSSSLGNKTIETCALSAFLKQDFPNYEFSERMEIAIEFKLVDK